MRRSPKCRRPLPICTILGYNVGGTSFSGFWRSHPRQGSIFPSGGVLVGHSLPANVFPQRLGMKHNERARVAPLYLTFTYPLSYTEKYMNGRLRRVAACGGLRPAAACGNRSPRRRRSLPLATLPPATLLFATLPACGGLRPPDAPRRRPAAPPCGGVPQPRPAAAARLRPWYSSPARAFGAAAAG